ncbi:ferrous iron transport protein B [Lachnospiraceae bacterium]|nr:ferrous iron transport protein B [Lachnospiraceae bacterium]
MKKIALLGQPNAGKSTIFNGLTGLHQHVGNWPGKTVEKKEGTFTVNGQEILVADLPGSYSLSANSDEEIVTRDYIISGNADLVLIIIDASQLERSLYMMADYAGIKVPAVLVLNLMDVAKKKGLTIDTDVLSKKLGIPVIPFVAADKKGYPELKNKLVKALEEKKSMSVDSFEEQFINQDFGYSDIKESVASAEDSQVSALWYAAKALEKDENVMQILSSKINSNDLNALKKKVDAIEKSALTSGICKFDAVHYLTSEVLTKKKETAEMSRFDKLATGRISGKIIAFVMVLLAFGVAMMIAAPIMGIAGMIPTYLSKPVASALSGVGVHPFIVTLISVVLLNIMFFVLAMAGFVLGVNFAFSFMEEIGYMARISFVFDNMMRRLGLQGKSICAFFMGLGCTMGGVTGTRVMDNYGQRLLAMALIWSVPCASTWSVIPTLATVFYGPVGSMLITFAIVAMMFLSIILVSIIFGKKLSPVEQRTGIVMELPPYHKPRWGHIIRTTLVKGVDVFKRALSTVLIVSIIFYVLSYSWDGKTSILMIVGQAIEPVTHLFGLTWEAFMAFLSSMIAKESMLGVMGALFGGTTDVVTIAFNAKNGVDTSVMSTLPDFFTKAEMLAFLFAVSFNMPCLMALSTTYKENHSKKWTAIIAGYYIAFALVLAFIAYHIGLIIF